VLSDAELGDRLRHAGLRSTGPRRAVVAVLGRRGHWSAAEVFAEVAKELNGTSLQAVYGILSALSEAGLLRKIELPGSPALYELRVEDNHHHLVCVRCGEVKDVPCAVGAAPCLTASDDHGYDIVAADVTFRGVCPDCRRAELAPA
jgi:Fur family ferric uptake transcriptional regulator